MTSSLRPLLEWRLGYERERLEVRARRLSRALVAVTAVAISMAVYLFNPGFMQRLELDTVDLRFDVRGESSPPRDIVMVAVDDATLRPYDGILPRALHGRLINRVNAAAPRAIAEDITFGGPKPGDGVLIRALERARSRLVLATPLDYRVLTDEDGRKHIQFGPVFGETEFFAQHGIQPGWTGLPVDDDDVVRRIDYAVEPEEDARFATLASASAQVAGVRTGELATGAERRASDGQSSHTTWIDYHGGAGTFRSVSARDVLSGRVTPDAFRDKIVVIGLVSRQFSEDWHPTSLDDSMAGPEINANAISTMLAGSDLRDVSRVVDGC